jgi:hypothetical protein
MEGSMDIKFEISKIKSLSEFVDEIDIRVVKTGFSFMIVINDTEEQDIKYIVDEIKSHFDIFILEETDRLDSRIQIDNSFLNGFHGIYYRAKTEISTIEKDNLLYSSTLFPKGSLFLEYTGIDSMEIDKILDMNFIPVLKSCDAGLLNYTKRKIDKIRKLSRYLKYVPLLEQVKCDYHIGDKLKRKVLLETDNLRQKLMIKNIEDSFNSSGL